jgi:hypothetical protein
MLLINQVVIENCIAALVPLRFDSPKGIALYLIIKIEGGGKCSESMTGAAGDNHL